MDQTILEFLLSHSAQSPVSFHMPGHKGSRLFRESGYGEFLDRIIDCDITEIPGADNLFQTEGIIRRTMERYRDLYETRQTYLLVNGSSAGLIASILSCVPRGGKLIMARNCHKSIFNGMALSGAQPVYAYPEMIREYGITGPITPEEIERCLSEAPDASAVLIPSPNYYGICCDIQKIAQIVHEAGKILIVDQAHGAHLKFFDRLGGRRIQTEECPMKRYMPEGEAPCDAGKSRITPLAAENLGADIVIGSTHKTLASLTQSAVANICSERVDLLAFEDALQRIESTSPSYVLMASLDINADLLENNWIELIGNWRYSLDRFYERAARIPGLSVMKHPLLDDSKINLDMSAYGLDGTSLEKALNEKGIWPELTTGNLVMCMTGIGNQPEDYRALIRALEEIAAERGEAAFSGTAEETTDESLRAWSWKDTVSHPIPERMVTIPISEAAGRISAKALIPYPPGIPIVCPGEELTEEMVRYLAELRRQGEHVMGIDEKGNILVGA